MTHPRTTRITALAQQLTDLEPPPVALARRLHDLARSELAREQRRGAPDRVVQALRYRAERAHGVLVDAWRQALRPS